jgi:pentatricopeptide repeat protein
MENDFDAFLLCEPDAISGMILRVPEMALNACDLCPGGGLSEKELYTLYCDDPGSRSASVVPNGPNLLGMNDDLLAEYDEAKEIAAAQLELAFEALSTMASRGLSADPDAFVSLMEACGRCGNTDRALQLIRIMKRDGFVADSEIYSCFLNSFAHVENATAKPKLETIQPEASKRNTDAYSALLEKKLQLSKAANGHSNPPGTWSASTRRDDDISDVLSDSSVSDTGLNLDSFVLTDIYKAVFTGETRQRRKKTKRGSRIIPGRPALSMTEGLTIQFVLGESLLTYLNPDLVIDTSRNSCPHCSSTLRIDDVVSGWKPCDFQDLTSGCPQCKHRFVPHFTVTSTARDFAGTQGKGTPLYCEFLSPWVLRKELEFVIHGNGGVEEMLKPEWRSGTDIRATLWWNLIVHFRRCNLPVAFLLQGSFHNRLINPTP